MSLDSGNFEDFPGVPFIESLAPESVIRQDSFEFLELSDLWCDFNGVCWSIKLWTNKKSTKYLLSWNSGKGALGEKYCALVCWKMAGNNPGAFNARLLHTDPVKKAGWHHARDFLAFSSTGNTETPLESFTAAKASDASYTASGTLQNGDVIWTEHPFLWEFTAHQVNFERLHANSYEKDNWKDRGLPSWDELYTRKMTWQDMVWLFWILRCQSWHWNLADQQWIGQLI